MLARLVYRPSRGDAPLPSQLWSRPKVLVDESIAFVGLSVAMALGCLLALQALRSLVLVFFFFNIVIVPGRIRGDGKNSPRPSNQSFPQFRPLATSLR